MNHCKDVTCQACGETYCIRCEGHQCPQCHHPYDDGAKPYDYIQRTGSVSPYVKSSRPSSPYKKEWQAPEITRTGAVDLYRVKFLDALLRMFDDTFSWELNITGEGCLKIEMTSDVRKSSLSLCLDMCAPEEQIHRDMKDIIRKIIFFA